MELYTSSCLQFASTCTAKEFSPAWKRTVNNQACHIFAVSRPIEVLLVSIFPAFDSNIKFMAIQIHNRNYSRKRGSR